MEKQEWKLTSLRLNLQEWGEEKGLLTGSASFRCGDTGTEVELKGVIVDTILAACAQAIADEAEAKMKLFTQQAQMLVGNLLEHK